MPFREIPLPAGAIGGTHVFIVGVDAYQHLPAPGGNGAGLNGPKYAPGLNQLNTAVISASLIANWFLSLFQSAEHPLASLDILLSPGSFTETGKAAVSVPEALFKNIRDAAAEWRERAHSNQNNHALFFFIGHGMEGTDHYLLPMDAFADVNAPAENLIMLHRTISRMLSCRAAMQAFFVDACRSPLSPPLKTQETDPQGIGRALLATSSITNNRHAPLFRSAKAKGLPAAGRNGRETFFTEGLLDCLRRLGADDDNGSGDFWIYADSLRQSLAERMRRLSLQNQLSLDCDFDLKDHSEPDAPLHQINAADCRVQASLTVQPTQMLPSTHLRMESTVAGLFERQPQSDPWLTEVPPEIYTVSGLDPVSLTPLQPPRLRQFVMPVQPFTVAV